MTAPNVAEAVDSPFGQTTSVDEMLAAETDAPVIDPEKIKIDGDSVPEEFRGKSAADLVRSIQGARDAVKISEEARRNAEALAHTAAASAGRVVSEPTLIAPTKHPLEEVTDAQIDELFASDEPADKRRAVEILTTRAELRASRHFSERMAGSAQALASQAFEDAKRRFADEFSLFGDQIIAVSQKMPATQLGTSHSWDALLATIRGLPENFDKLVEHRQTKKAREVAIADTGFTPSRVATRPVAAPSGPSSTQSFGLDETQRRIAVTQFPEARTPEEAYVLYKKYS
jgi:hypothetical protein